MSLARWGCSLLLASSLLAAIAEAQTLGRFDVARADQQQPQVVADTSAAARLFGFQRQVVRNARGVDEVFYVRQRENKTAAVLTPAQYDPFARQVDLFEQENPWTARTWRNCPPLIDFVAGKLEAAAEYVGSRDGDHVYPHAWGQRFWSQEPSFTGRDQFGAQQTWGDPIDGTMFFLMEMLNASRAADFKRVWIEARDAHRQILAAPGDANTRMQNWEQNRTRWINAEAGLKAENLAWAVQILRDNARGLSLQANIEAGYGRSYVQYARWVDSVTQNDGRVDYGRLTEMLLANRGAYQSSPQNPRESYAARLQAVFAQYLSLPR